VILTDGCADSSAFKQSIITGNRADPQKDHPGPEDIFAGGVCQLLANYRKNQEIEYSAHKSDRNNDGFQQICQS